MEAVRDLKAFVAEHQGPLFLTTVAAAAQQHYAQHGPSPHVVVLPGLAAAMFFVLPVWAVVFHESRDRLAWALASVGLVAALAPALVWSSWPHGEKLLKAEPRPLALGVLLGVVLVTAAMAKADVKWADWGLGLGDWRWWGRPVGFLVALILVAMPLVLWLFPEFASFYPVYKPARADWTQLLRFELAMAVYMFCWEFFFRGFMLFGLARRYGAMPAILIQAFPFFVLHDFKPAPEMAMSWFGGILIGWLCWRARCVWPGVILHSLLYITMEVAAFVVRNL